QQSAVAGEVNVLVGPQTQHNELGDGIQRVVGSAMGIAASVRQRGQLAKNGDRDPGAQSGLKLGHGGDFLIPEEVQNLVGEEVNGIHNVILTPLCALSSVIVTFCLRSPSSEVQ